MAVEAQRIIAVSLGKIQSSRQKRTGVDLHKNLLVSTVLLKARSQYMIESYRAAVQAQQQKEFLPEPIVAAAAIDNSSDSSCIYGDESELCGNKENSPPQQTRVESSDLEDELCGDDDCFEANENDKPSSSPSDISASSTPEVVDSRDEESCSNVLEEKDVNILEIGALPTCASIRNKKRRHSEVYEWEIDGNKRSKTDNCENDFCDNDSEDLPRVYTELEVPQLSSLVNIFNSGFSGLSGQTLTSSSPSTDCVSKNSCSISIRNAFDSITRPILAVAMSV